MSAAGDRVTVLPTASAASSVVRRVSAPAAAVGERSVPGMSPDGNGGDSSGGTIEAKSSSNNFFGHVRLGIVKRWSQTVFARAQRHQKRGKTKCLQAAAVAKSLLSNDTWVKRLRVAGKPVDKGVLSRVIGMAVTFSERGECDQVGEYRRGGRSCRTTDRRVG